VSLKRSCTLSFAFPPRPVQQSCQSVRQNIAPFSLAKHDECAWLAIRAIWRGVARFPVRASRFPSRIPATCEAGASYKNLRRRVCITILTATGVREPPRNCHPHRCRCTIRSPCLLLVAVQAGQVRPLSPTALHSVDRRLVDECFLLRLGASTLRKISLVIPKAIDFECIAIRY
jgi:hypothetical protein